MTHFLVELSAENVPLARAETDEAASALGGEPVSPEVVPITGHWASVELDGASAARRLATRLALARRVLLPLISGSAKEVADALGRAGSSGRVASIRLLPGSPPDGGEVPVAKLGAAYRAGGGFINLEHPVVRFFVGPLGPAAWILLEEVRPVDRAVYSARSMPRLPFQRPVSLPPRRARAAANLARVSPGSTVADPFVGTGALLAESALLGAHVLGVDRDSAMVRGAMLNFDRLGITPTRMSVADAGDAAALPTEPLDAIVTDPPYGRASGSGGETTDALVARVLPRWAARLKPSGRLVVILPGGPDPLGPPFTRVRSIPDRVHGSLTREFRVYAQSLDAMDPTRQ